MHPAKKGGLTITAPEGSICGLYPDGPATTHYFQVIKPAVDDLETGHFSGTLCFFGSHNREFIRGDDYMAQIATAQVADHDAVTTLLTFEQCAGTGDLHIIGVAGNN